MKNIPEWQYPLYKNSDKVAYLFLKKLGKSKKYPQIIGPKDEVNSLLKLLILSQKTKDYRLFRDIVLTELKKEKFNLANILEQEKNIEISNGIDESWAIFIQDKRICELIDDVRKTKIDFQGSNDEIVEFIVRFWLSQLLQDWRGPLMAVALECLKNRKVNILKLNNLLKIWDCTKIFTK